MQRRAQPTQPSKSRRVGDARCDGEAVGGDGPDVDDDEGGPVASGSARALPAADVEDDGEAPSTSTERLIYR